MGTSTIDGTVEAAELRRSARGVSIFNSIRFKLDDGSTRTITKAVAKQTIADQLVPGSSGRFYLFTGLDIKGVHGVRRSDGTAICDFPSSNEKIFLIVIAVNIAWVALRMTTDGSIPLLGVALLLFGGVCYFLYRKVGREAAAQFAADSAAPRARPEPVTETGA